VVKKDALLGRANIKKNRKNATIWSREAREVSQGTRVGRPARTHCTKVKLFGTIIKKKLKVSALLKATFVTL
jgi:hypothetical protein